MSVMNCENNNKLQININTKQAVEAEVIKALKTEGIKTIIL